MGVKDIVTTTKGDYRRLLKAEAKLNLLENGGVDNWDGYGESLNPDGQDSYHEICEAIDEEYN